MALSQEIKQEWIAALKSGFYSQGIGALLYAGRHCHLGVLCDVLSKKRLGFWDIASSLPSDHGIHYCMDGDRSWRELPYTLAKKLRVQVDPKAKMPSGEVLLLSRLNDYVKDWAALADTIDQAEII